MSDKRGMEVITCYRCGRDMDEHYRLEGETGIGGECAECGDTLCGDCAKWDKYGICKLCQEWELLTETAGA